MSEYLKRYLAGDVWQVWDEIAPLRYATLAADIRQDVEAVCNETMRRVRLNVRRVIDSLASIGYEFGVYPHGGRYSGYEGPLTKPDVHIVRKIAQLESQIGSLPLSLRTFWKHIGSVCLIGRTPGWPDYADPLVVECIDGTLGELEEWRRRIGEFGPDEEERLRAVIAPDVYHKDDVSGGDWYGIELPCETVDAKLTSEPHETIFVNYLRIALQCKGFPGAPEPPAMLANLEISLQEF